jgi:3',5'-cyclic AMP phosphodiesterase CpdA
VSTVTWLHISDLHWRESETYDANIVARALLNDLAKRDEIAPELAHIDFVFVTGDIAFAGQSEEYRLAERFFDDLRRTTGVRKERTFVVPGNHDVDRSVISDETRDILDRLGNRQAVNRLLGYDVDRAKIMQRLHRYQHFVNDYWGNHLPFDNVRYSYVKRCRVKRGEDSYTWVEILGLNSAWASASDNDRHNLFLGERQVRSALDQTRRAGIRIVLMHHPFEWLRDFDRDDCEALLLDKCDFILHGHLHRTGAMQIESPGGNAIVFSAGACYEGRKYPNTYNLVVLDFDAGEGTIYLRIYSDQQGGFWTQDSMTYRRVRGEYTFRLPHTEVADESEELSVGEIAAELEEIKDVGEISTRPLTRFRATLATWTISVPGRYDAGLAGWWRERGYASNPFAYHSAADVSDGDLSQVFPLWHIDPNVPANWRGLGQTPTLDEVESLETNELVLIYTPSGGGKTFYRRWSAQQIEECESLQCAVEVSNLAGQICNPTEVTARDLAICIYEQVCMRCSVRAPLAPAEHVAQILEQCDDMMKHFSSGQQVPKRIYVFVDDVDQLFDERRVEQNLYALMAIADLCRIAAARGGGEPLALRIFVPLELKEPVQRILGVRGRQRIREYTIRWSAEHCQAVVEARLDSYWKLGPNTGIVHLSRLLTSDAINEFHRWLQRQQGISPRCVIRVFDDLGHYAHRRGVAADTLIDARRWNEFLKTGRPGLLCASGVRYPLVRSPSKSLRWVLMAVLLMISLGIVLWASAPARDILKTTFLSLAHLVRGAVSWLATVSDFVEGVLILAAVLGSAIFMFWRLKTWHDEGARRGRSPDLRKCLQAICQLIRPMC